MSILFPLGTSGFLIAGMLLLLLAGGLQGIALAHLICSRCMFAPQLMIPIIASCIVAGQIAFYLEVYLAMFVAFKIKERRK